MLAMDLQGALTALLSFKRDLVSDGLHANTAPTIPGRHLSMMTVAKDLMRVMKSEDMDLPLSVPMPVSHQTKMTPM
jgi:hypothetical protein